MYNLKIIKCGDRLEIYKVHNYIINESSKAEGYKIVDKLLAEYEQEHEEQEEKQDTKQSKKDRVRNLTDARNNIIRLIKCNSDMKTFITLTFAKEQDYKQSKKSLDDLFHKLRKKYSELKYLWVLEYGEKNNRLHYHLLCNIQIDIKLSSSKEKKSLEHKELEQDFEKKYWKYGWVDIRSLEQEDNTNIALYVATYIVKSMENLDLEGYRVYGYSRKTVDKPVERKIYTTNSLEDILKLYSKDYKIVFNNSYKIGYTKDGQEHKGIVSYLDLIKI